MFKRQKVLHLSLFVHHVCSTEKFPNTGDAYKATAGGSGVLTVSPGISDSPQSPKGQSEDSIPDEESDDFRAKDQPSGVMDAQCGRRSSTGFRNLRPWGPHITRGLSSVSPAAGRAGRG